jgi:hypothetical protein
MTNCKYCDEEITFSEDHISESGKKIPLDFDSEEPHQCMARVSSISCIKCGDEIQFSRNRLSKSGKKIPLGIVNVTLLHVGMVAVRLSHSTRHL